MQELVISYEKRKRILKYTGIAFLTVILILTFLSKTIDNFLLPEVDTQKPTNGVLKNDIREQGVISFLGSEKISASGEWRIISVNAKQNIEVNKGDLLAVVNRDDVQYDLKKLELEIITLENDLLNYKDEYPDSSLSIYEEDADKAKKQIKEQEQELSDAKEMYTAGAVSLSSVKDIEKLLENAKSDLISKLNLLKEKKAEIEKKKLKYERTLKQKKLEVELKKLEFQKTGAYIPVNGEIRAPVDGIIRYASAVSGTKSSPGQVLFEIGKTDDTILVSWKLENNAAKLINEGAFMEILSEIPEMIIVEGKISNKSLDAANDLVELTAELDKTEDSGKLISGQKVDIIVPNESSRYDIVVPNNSIVRPGGGNDHVFVLKERAKALGVEKYVEMVPVEVLASDDTNSAIKGMINQNDDIVIYSSKSLTDNLKVKTSFDGE